MDYSTMTRERPWMHDDCPSTETVRLERFKLMLMRYLSEADLGFGEPLEAKMSAHVGFIGNEIAIRLVQPVWGREAKRQECKWPADWWQAFKERWFPAWAKARWPVEYHTEVMTVRELYPALRMPDKRYHAEFVVVKGHDDSTI